MEGMSHNDCGKGAKRKDAEEFFVLLGGLCVLVAKLVE
jgi:hypothetical protein